jgi:predicted RND superfamily exporter protein
VEPSHFDRGLHGWVERAFSRWAILLVRGSRWWWWGVGLLSAILLTGVPRLQMDVRLNAFLIEDDPDYLAFQALRQRFDNDELLLVVVAPPAGMSLLDPAMMDGLRAVHDGATRIDSVAWVSSLARARRLQVGTQTLSWEPWLPVDATAADAAAILREEALRGRLVGRDRRTLILRLGIENSDSLTLVPDLRELLRVHMPAGSHWWMVGTPVVKEALRASLRVDGARVGPAAAVVCFFVLALALRSLRHALITVGVAVLATLWTLGLMGWVGAPLTIVSVIVPTLILVIGLTDGIHLVTDAGHRGVIHSLKRVGPACLWTSVTTIAGFLGLTFMGVPALRDTGTWTALGIAIALIHGVVTLPLLLRKFPYHPGVELEKAGRPGWWGHRTARPTVAVALLAFVACVPGIQRLHSETDLVRYFATDDPLRVGYRQAEAALGGSTPLSLLVERRDGGVMIDEGPLAVMERLRTACLGHPLVLSVDALPSLLHELQGEEPDSRAPITRETAAQLLLLAELAGASGPANVLLSSDQEVARLLLFLPELSSRRMVEVADWLRRTATEVAGQEYRVSLAGNALHQANTMNAIDYGLPRGMAVALLLIAILFRSLLGSWGWSTIALLPNMLPIVGVLGTMGWVRCPLDLSTAMTGSVALGLAVDDTIHMALGYRHHRQRRMGVEEAMAVTLATSGRALRLTTVVLMAGFGLLGLSSFAPTRRFGLLTCLTLALALAADLVLLPALIRLWEGRRRPTS